MSENGLEGNKTIGMNEGWRKLWWKGIKQEMWMKDEKL